MYLEARDYPQGVIRPATPCPRQTAPKGPGVETPVS